MEELLQNFKKMKQVYNKTLKQLANKDLGDLPQSSSESTQESHKKNLNDTLQDINSKVSLEPGECVVCFFYIENILDGRLAIGCNRYGSQAETKETKSAG